MDLKTESQLARFLALHRLADYQSLCQRAAVDPEWFWRAVIAFHNIHFFKPFDRLLDVSRGPMWPEWCVGGTTNLAWNCLDRTIQAGRGSHRAIVWEGEDGEQRSLNYDELSTLTRRAAAGLSDLGCGRGDVIGLYMPMVPETIAAYLAVVSIGAVALPMFSGFGAAAIAERLADAEAKAVFTADITYRRGKKIDMLKVVEEARPLIPTLRHVIVVERGCSDEPIGGHNRSWNDLVARTEGAAPLELPAETTAMIVYTSGTTGKPKGTVHSHCGFMVKVGLDFGLVRDLHPSDRLL